MILDKYSAEPITEVVSVNTYNSLFGIQSTSEQFIHGYLCKPINVRIVGAYETACGGCDTIDTQDEVMKTIEDYAKLGSVVFEGVILSTVYMNWLKFSRKLKLANKQNSYVWAFMDTPYSLCLERIQQRNKGVKIQENLVQAKYDRMKRIAYLAKRAGERVIWINHKDPLPVLESLLEIKL
jgi:hypothetical protein